MAKHDEELGQALTLVAYHTSASMIAIRILAKCLVASGTLPEGRFEKALRDTIEHEGAERHRPDYQWLAMLLKQLENEPGDEPRLQ